MSLPPAIEFDTLVQVIDRSIRAPEVRSLFAGVEFTKSIDTWRSTVPGQTPYFYAAHALGFELCADGEGTVKLVYLYSPDAKHGFASYRGALPGGLSLQSTPAEVRAALGLPTKSGAEQLVPTVGKVGPWDRYDRDSVILHFQYSARGRQVAVVTLMAPDRVP